MSFKDLELKRSYSSDIDDILCDFYIPVLRESIDYQRLSGFFSSTSLSVAASGIGGLIKNNGMMKLLISPKISKNDLDVIEKSSANPGEFIESHMILDLEKLKNEFERDHVFALGWMLAKNKIEMRVAIVFDKYGKMLNFEEIEESGIFHQKVAIFKDLQGNTITFSGSVNESASGWLGHIEEFKVFRSWNTSEIDYLNSDIEKFNRFWENKSPRVKVIDLPESVKNKLVEIAPSDFEKRDLERWYKRKRERLSLFGYQNQAIKSWIDNDMQGIFNMATGTGKTFTALGCLKYAIEVKQPLLAVITTPYSHLVQQWNRETNRFGINYEKIIIADSKTNWKNQLADTLRDLELGHINNCIVLTTHATFSSRDFIDIIQLAEKSKSNFILIADEVHGLGAEKRRNGLIPDYQMRLGLSATPSRFFDDIGTDTLLNYFGPVVSYFSLEDAMIKANPTTGKTYLTPYEYYPIFLTLNDDEREEYIAKTRSIAIKVSKAKNSDEQKERLKNLFISRSRIIKNANSKFESLNQLLIDLGPSINSTIIYCEDKGQMNKVIEITNELNIISHRFTMEEGTVPQKKYNGLSQRDFLLDNFSKGIYQVLVAKKCLDEGVDVPSAKIAIIMASSTNPREYIQRIGRVIRRFPNKNEAIIYDMIIAPSIGRLPPEMKKIERDIFIKELQRSQYIAQFALNNVDALMILHKKMQEG